MKIDEQYQRKNGKLRTAGGLARVSNSNEFDAAFRVRSPVEIQWLRGVIVKPFHNQKGKHE